MVDIGRGAAAAAIGLIRAPRHAPRAQRMWFGAGLLTGLTGLRYDGSARSMAHEAGPSGRTTWKAHPVFITKFASTAAVRGDAPHAPGCWVRYAERFDVEVIGFVEGGEPAPRSRASTAFTSFRTGRP